MLVGVGTKEVLDSCIDLCNVIRRKVIRKVIFRREVGAGPS